MKAGLELNPDGTGFILIAPTFPHSVTSRVAAKWRSGRRRRTNLRRSYEQRRAATELTTWLQDIIRPNGTIVGTSPDIEDDSIAFDISINGRRLTVSFETLTMWAHLYRRDLVHDDIVAAVSDPLCTERGFLLSGCVETIHMLDRRDG